MQTAKLFCFICILINLPHNNESQTRGANYGPNMKITSHIRGYRLRIKHEKI